jgi:hypothetical protein
VEESVMGVPGIDSGRWFRLCFAMALIEVCGLGKRYGLKRVLRDVDLAVDRGEIQQDF